jgi:hypothetical protein
MASLAPSTLLLQIADAGASIRVDQHGRLVIKDRALVPAALLSEVQRLRTVLIRDLTVPLPRLRYCTIDGCLQMIPTCSLRCLQHQDDEDAP